MDLLPAEDRDLSALLLKLSVRGLSEPVDETGYDADLAAYLRENISGDRQQFWHRALLHMFDTVPNASATSVVDPHYPTNLLDCFDLPPVLFVRGHVDSTDALSVAIVGSRKANTSELEAATNLASAAAEANVTVVSGLAAGVDTRAHEGALSVGGRTVAVIGCGLDRLAHNLELSSRISRSGAVLTPYRPGSPATRSSFVSRNAVISGLSLVSVLVAADPNSGSLSEAEAALRQSRKVLLWAPSLERSRWARTFVTSDPNVAFFDHPAELVRLANTEAGRLRARVHEAAG